MVPIFCNSLKVDNWKIEYDKDENLVETEDKNFPMKAEKEIKYLGFVVSEDAKNVKNILGRRNKSSNTIRNIKSMISGLGTYSLEAGIIYFKSLLRSSLLYAAETYYNLTGVIIYSECQLSNRHRKGCLQS